MTATVFVFKARSAGPKRARRSGLPADLSDITNHPDPGVRATGYAMLYAARLYGPALRAAVAADAASGIPLLGTQTRWGLVHELSGTDDPAGVVLVPCDWRTSRDSHCRCWRCTVQDIEVLLARAIIAPCPAKGTGQCYWCDSAGNKDCYADGISLAAQRLADHALRGAQVLRLFGDAP